MSKWFVECDCKTHLIGIETWDEATCLAFFEMGHCDDGHTSLKEKWRLIRQILKRGHPYLDMVVLNRNTVGKLIGILEKARVAALAYEKKQEDKP